MHWPVRGPHEIGQGSVRILVLSDLHLEFGDVDVAGGAADVVVLAGDIHVGVKGLQWAQRTFPDVPVVYVLGNHEYYGEVFHRLALELASLARGTNVHVLERAGVVIDGVHFLGCTLWTDFALFGAPERGRTLAADSMTDYQVIKAMPEERPLRPEDTLAAHVRSKKWLARELHRSRGPTVVVSHHAPSLRSLPPPDREVELACAYASPLDEFVAESGARLWVHGHIHDSRDYVIGATRVVANPRGYPPQYPRSNPRFDPGWIVEI